MWPTAAYIRGIVSSSPVNKELHIASTDTERKTECIKCQAVFYQIQSNVGSLLTPEYLIKEHIP